MKKRLMQMTVAAVLMTGAGAWAQDDMGTQQGTGGSDRSALQSSTGMNLNQLRVGSLKVTSVDRKHHKVTLEAQVSPEAEFTQESGEPIRIDQLEKGDEIRAAFDPATGQIKAIQVTKSKTTK